MDRARTDRDSEPAAEWQQLQLTRETLVDRVTNQLRQQILSGRLERGTPMPTERAIGEAFGVGRTTIREALQRLVSSGFLERRSTQLIVRDPSEIPAHDADIGALAARLSVRDVFETRKLLESKAVALAAVNWSDGDLDELREALEQMRIASQPDRHDADFHAADVAFHSTVLRLAKNAVLERVYESSKHLFFKLPAFWRVFAGPVDTPKPITGFEGHRQIVEAIERRDPEEAARVSDAILDRVASTLIDRLERARVARPDGPTDTTVPPTTLLNSGGSI